MRRDQRLTKGLTMNAFNKATRRAGLILAFIVSAAVSSTSSFAFSPEAQQMCTGDAMRLCGSEIPNVSKVTACMRRNRSNLSTGCRTVMDRDLAQQSKTVAAK